jgi:hypothetical protein
MYSKKITLGSNHHIYFHDHVKGLRLITSAQNILMMLVSLLGRQGFPWDVSVVVQGVG